MYKRRIRLVQTFQTVSWYLLWCKVQHSRKVLSSLKEICLIMGLKLNVYEKHWRGAERGCHVDKLIFREGVKFNGTTGKLECELVGKGNCWKEGVDINKRSYAGCIYRSSSQNASSICTWLICKILPMASRSTPTLGLLWLVPISQRR